MGKEIEPRLDGVFRLRGAYGGQAPCRGGFDGTALLADGGRGLAALPMADASRSYD